MDKRVIIECMGRGGTGKMATMMARLHKLQASGAKIFITMPKNHGRNEATEMQRELYEHQRRIENAINHYEEREKLLKGATNENTIESFNNGLIKTRRRNTPKFTNDTHYSRSGRRSWDFH